MSLQEHFDHIVTNLLKQGRKSFDTDGKTCMYRGQDGCRCAAGWVIPDDKYSPTMEGDNVQSRKVRDALPEELQNDDGFLFINRMQMVHDNVDVPYWCDEFRDVASRFKLECSALNA